MHIGELLEMLGRLGLAGAFLAMIIAGLKGMIIFKPSHDKIVGLLEQRCTSLECERDEWKQLAWGFREQTSRAVEVAKSSVELTKSQAGDK